MRKCSESWRRTVLLRTPAPWGWSRNLIDMTSCTCLFKVRYVRTDRSVSRVHWTGLLRPPRCGVLDFCLNYSAFRFVAENWHLYKKVQAVLRFFPFRMAAVLQITAMSDFSSLYSLRKITKELRAYLLRWMLFLSFSSRLFSSRLRRRETKLQFYLVFSLGRAVWFWPSGLTELSVEAPPTFLLSLQFPFSGRVTRVGATRYTSINLALVVKVGVSSVTGTDWLTNWLTN